MKKSFKKAAAVSLLALAVMGLSACGKDKEQAKSASQDAAPAAAAQAKDAAPAGVVNDKSSFEQKVSYSIGASVGLYINNLKTSQKDFINGLDDKLIVAGVEDALKNKLALDSKQVESVLSDLDKQIQEKMAAKAKADAKANLEAGEKFLAENKTKEGVVTTASGLQYKVITEGKGEKAKKGDTIYVTYKGTTVDGTVFDEQKKAVEFPLENMIPGWIEALQLMAPGAHYELYIPSSLAYGETGAGQVIKPNSVLIFDVTLERIKPHQEAKQAEKPAGSADVKNEAKK